MSESARIKATSYAHRNTILRALGFLDYRKYIETLRWMAIRNQVIHAARGYCSGCQERASQVHHEWYSWDNLTGNDLTGLHPLCQRCHTLIETAGGEKIMDFQEVDRRFSILIKGGYQAAVDTLGAIPEKPHQRECTGPQTGLAEICSPQPPKQGKPKFVSRASMSPEQRVRHTIKCARAGKEDSLRRKG